MQALWQSCVSVAVVILAFMVLNKDTKIIIQPETLGSDAWITRSDASQSYKEAWGLMLAMLSGNVTPDNVTFIKDRYKPLLSPRLYNEIIDALEIQSQNIKEDRITIRFEPKAVSYEPESDKVFVYGFSFVKGPTGDEEREERTYEYTIRIKQFAPMIIHLDTYQEKPRTLKVLEQMEKQEEIRSRRDA
jgi:conjugal transfer pilus assembly protein TraE